MIHKDPRTMESADPSLTVIQTAQAAVERGEATAAEFDRLVALDWIDITSNPGLPCLGENGKRHRKGVSP